ncbi:TerB family tellurite resistance protein [Pseudoalteromonas haloplanktis]|uniref:TerB family tellurite resistance protein n=1 Tax=Pseudoalteromonas haloplanktis TaxID=228 RepID=A0ABU1B7J7_PSEHA|nr:TerB family tellurite resistance protein [Pseudoalteromonas haloplanktis]MDQ9090513.1 TerB family tellurite resistance protein [Pseudoalteromonas haloplanktis]
MDFDILDVINDATKEADAFEGHPAADFTMEEQLLYLNGLALVMNADGHIDDTEKEYIRILIKSMNLDESILDDMVTFAKAPDKDTVQAFFRTFRRRPVAQLFLFDALMMTRRDGKVEDKEKTVVDKIADQLEILKGTQQDIFDLFCHIKNRNWQESALYFSSHLLNPEHFKHLLAYHEIEFDALMAETAEIRSNRLIEVIKQKIDIDALEWERLEYRNADSSFGATEITNTFISNIFTQTLILPFLQSKLDRKELRINADEVLLIKDGVEQAYGSLADLTLSYDKEIDAFFVTPNLTEDSAFKVTAELMSDFGFMISEHLLKGKDIERNDPQVINIILEQLYSTKIVCGEQNAAYSERISMPQSRKNCSANTFTHLKYEIVLGFNNNFYINNNGSDYVEKANCSKLTPWEVLASGQFRLMR